MSMTTSPATSRRYGVVMVAQEWKLPRSSFYRRKTPPTPCSAVPPKKRGPRTALTDTALTQHIREDLAATPFHGEGHRKVWARLRFRGIRTSKARVLRLMREHGLLAPYRAQRVLGPRNHDGTIVTERPDEMWGTDATTTLTTHDGQATVFIVVDHCTTECLGIHAAKRGDRFEALEVIRQAVRQTQGCYTAAIAAGLKLRHDHGSQFVSDDYQDEIAFLGIESSPSYVRQPEGNGCSERFIRTLKEQLLWIKRFDTVEELRLALVAWAKQYNENWILGKYGYLTPKQVRQTLLPQATVA